jgi:hypothetical protein
MSGLNCSRKKLLLQFDVLEVRRTPSTSATKLWYNNFFRLLVESKKILGESSGVVQHLFRYYCDTHGLNS